MLNHNYCSCWAPVQPWGERGTHTRSADHKVSFLMHVVVVNNYVLFVISTCLILVVGFCLVALCKVLLGALDGNSNVEAFCFGILKGQVFADRSVFTFHSTTSRNILLYYVMPIPISYLTWWSWHWFGISLSSFKLGFDFPSKKLCFSMFPCFLLLFEDALDLYWTSGAVSSQTFWLTIDISWEILSRHTKWRKSTWQRK